MTEEEPKKIDQPQQEQQPTETPEQASARHRREAIEVRDQIDRQHFESRERERRRKRRR